MFFIFFKIINSHEKFFKLRISLIVYSSLLEICIFAEKYLFIKQKLKLKILIHNILFKQQALDFLTKKSNNITEYFTRILLFSIFKENSFN